MNDYMVNIMNQMCAIIDKFPELESECPELKNSELYKKLCVARDELMNHMVKQTELMNKTLDDMAVNNAVGADKFSKDN